MFQGGRTRRRWLLVVAIASAIGIAATACSDTSALEGRVEALEAKAAKLEEQGAVSVATAAQTAAPAQAILEYRDHGFGLPLPEGVQVREAGIGTAAASAQDGQLTASAGNTSMVLVWTSSEATAETSLQGAFQVLAASQPEMTFQPLSEGKFKVDSQDAAYGAFGALNKDKLVLGVGVVGGWTCADGRSYALTVAGDDLTQVQSSFAGFTGSFRCSA